MTATATVAIRSVFFTIVLPGTNATRLRAGACGLASRARWLLSTAGTQSSDGVHYDVLGGF